MAWRDWLGLSSGRERFARALMQQLTDRGATGWSYDPNEAALVHTDARKFFVNNAWREYSGASRTARRALLDKYANVLLMAGDQIQELWEVAATRLYACLRSRYQLVSLEINGRGTGNSVRKPLAKRWHGDLDIVLMYDLGPSLYMVTAEVSAPWAQTLDDLFARAQANLAALDRPSWQDIGGGVFQLASAVSFEESFVLVPDVWKSLPVQGEPVVAVPNRGVLLATGGNDPAALSRLVSEAQRSMQERPWPLSATLLHRVGDDWQPLELDSRIESAAHAFEQLSLAITYAEQKQALEKHFERHHVDIFVAPFDLMKTDTAAHDIQSWCSWAEGVESLLPPTDVVILGRGNERADAIAVPWRELVKICSRYMHATEDDPPRFRVNSFPTDEWPQLEAVGSKLKLTER